MASPTSNSTTPLATTQNIHDLAAVIHKEAGGIPGIAGKTARTMVGFTVVNRMNRNDVTVVRRAWHGYAHRNTHQATELALAKAILDGTEPDISQGATHFYTPGQMPHEGTSTRGRDVSGGLETVPGVNGATYKPGWTTSYAPVSVPNVPPNIFKFYKAPGNGRVR